ncbi:MAG: hypothetical protein RQM92_12295 [Candidatus Syntrophopropionicum ammoniitolerans]
MSFGEAYMDGVIDYEGDFAEIIRVAELNKDRLPNSGLGGKMISALQSLNKTVAKKSSKKILSTTMTWETIFSPYGWME